MQPSYAEASCVLKVDVNCGSCKMKMLEVLGSICGKYYVEINSEEGLAHIHGLVEPNLFLTTLARPGCHAELKWVKIRHPKMSQPGDNRHIGYGHRCGLTDSPCSYNQALPDPSSYTEYPRSSYYCGSNPNYYRSDFPPARYVASYPPVEYGSHVDESFNFCSVM